MSNVPSKMRACTTFRLARTAFTYWPMLSIDHECYCSQGRQMRARRNKIRGNIVLVACQPSVLSVRTDVLSTSYALNKQVSEPVSSYIISLLCPLSRVSVRVQKDDVYPH